MGTTHKGRKGNRLVTTMSKVQRELRSKDYTLNRAGRRAK